MHFQDTAGSMHTREERFKIGIKETNFYNLLRQITFSKYCSLPPCIFDRSVFSSLDIESKLQFTLISFLIQCILCSLVALILYVLRLYSVSTTKLLNKKRWEEGERKRLRDWKRGEGITEQTEDGI